mgnify:CR=1 FL=1
MSEISYDLIVLGGGPAGYAAAIRAGQLGKKAVVVEMERAGGTCLNWGCIPSKALLKSAETYQNLKHTEDLGISCGDISYDFEKIIKRSRGVADQMGGGIEFLFKKNKVDYIVGKGTVKSAREVEISEGNDDGKIISGSKIMIATGCKPRTLDDVAVDGVRVMTSREALAMKKQPESIAIMGAGAIGAEFAYFLNAFGTKVTLVEMLPNVLPVEDREISDALLKSFAKQGIDCRTSTRIDNIEVKDESVVLSMAKGDDTEQLEVKSLLLAIGVVPNLDGAVSEDLNLELNRGYLKVDENYQTSTPGIYATGDIVGPPWLAHVATYRAIQAVNGMFEHSKPIPFDAFPGCTYCQPQVGSLGLTEERAIKLGKKIAVGKFSFKSSGRALATNDKRGFVKLIFDTKYGELLGAHIVGTEATEMIAELGIAKALEATWDDLAMTIHAHPTLSEAIMEAAMDARGDSIHQ